MVSVKIRTVSEVANRIRLYELVPLESGSLLPAFTAGAHIAVKLSIGERQYSLCNDPCERHRYVIAVQREDAGRGGSVEVHRTFHVGDVIEIRDPVNHFELSDHGVPKILIAGGIGITPILSMARSLTHAGKEFSIAYLSRAPEDAAFLEELAILRDRGINVTIHNDSVAGGRLFDLRRLLANASGSEVYCCGPAGLMTAVASCAAHLPSADVHFEHFSASTELHKDEDRAFEVVLGRSGKRLSVSPDRTILDVLLEARCDVDFSCEEGTCGTCITRMLAGEADHRDIVLSEEERKTHILVCCSRSRTPSLTLDL